MKAPPGREPGQIVTAAYRRDGKLRYEADDRAIVGRNGPYFNNRPLYGPAYAPGAVVEGPGVEGPAPSGVEGVTLAGDRPFVRLLARPYVLGSFAAAIVRSDGGRWFHEFGTVAASYRCGRMAWTISDPGLPGMEATLTVAPRRTGAGFTARLEARGVAPGDRLVWTFGGARPDDDPRTHWDPVNRGNPQVYRGGDAVKAELTIGPMPAWSRGNAVSLEGGGFRVAAGADATVAVLGRSDRGGTRTVADAAAGATPAALAGSAAGDLPVACEVIALRAGRDEVYWSFAAGAAGGGGVDRPEQDFADALATLESVERMRTETPEPRLDAAVAAVCHPIDGNCERGSFIFRHGCMSWSIRFLGWRVIAGATVLGWHERVRGNAAHYAAAQVVDAGDRTEPRADPSMRLCQEGPSSRLYGRGRIPLDQHFYNTQTQFFDQTIRDWRWTADPALEKILRPALELHLEWARACFDPDGDGLYESYINTLPTDSMWYNGGGSVEESAYVFYGHRAAADLARRAGDTVAEARHRAQAEKIQRALRDGLWLKERGHFGVYVEQGGHRRVHADAWTYSQFLPIDAGMTTPDEAIQALYFTEWALERIRLPYGGVVCQASNWVPSKWSVRDMFSGDLCQLALAYFQSGLGDEGWDLLHGTTLEGCYASAVPGGFSHIGAGTDFGDSAHEFARVVAEGLFGFDPDYPNGVVRLHPAFPAAWEHAALRIPDYALEYRREGAAERDRVTLARGAAVELRLPVRATGVRRVMLGGREVSWTAEPGYGCTWICFRVASALRLTIDIELVERAPAASARNIEAKVGDQVRLELGEKSSAGVPPAISTTAGGTPALLNKDFHDILIDTHLAGHALTARIAPKPGHHLVLVGITVGDLPQWQVFKLKVSDPAGEAERASRTPREAPHDAAWTCLDLAPHANGDVRAIFQQQYLSPRPKTCSVRLGVDGYSAWTFPHWREGPPKIDLSHLDRLASGPGRIRTPQHVPFARFALERNIVFTSLWDNWPRAVTIPVNRAAGAAWLLVCGSTFPMQTRIANAELRFRYADGGIERLELVPPLNFWSLCPWGGLDYSYESDAWCLPPTPPPTVQLGAHCRAMVLSWTLRPGAALQDITLETLSQDVVIGLMGVSLMD